MGFPFVEGHPNPDFYVRGPLVLFPISLYLKRQAKNGGWFLHFADKRPILNGALITALKIKGEYDFPDDYEKEFDDLIEEISSVEVQNVDEYFFEKIKDWFNNLIQTDESKNRMESSSLPPLNRDDIDSLSIQPIHLVNYKIIGNFPQADNEIYKDYNKLVQTAGKSDVGIIGKLIGVENPSKESSTYDDTPVEIDRVKDIELNTVLESDSSQDAVIIESKKSDLVVVRGPPGTGKSQVIVNLISDALTNDKKVLVACQKRAALEVVRQRLAKIGLDRYAVFLEKEIDDRRKMYQQIYGIIEAESKPTQNTDVTIKQISGKIDKCVSNLSEFGLALRREYFGGATAHKIYSRANGNHSPVLDLSSVDLKLDWTDLDEYIQKIKNIEDAFKKFEDDNHPWFGRTDFAHFSLIDKSNLERQLERLTELSPNCVLVSNPDDQSRLPALCEKYLSNLQLLQNEDARLSQQIERILGRKVTDQFVRDNIEAVKKGVDFWVVFQRLLGVFDVEKQSRLLSMTADTESLLSHMREMRRTLGDLDAVWFRRDDLHRLDAEEKKNLQEWLEETTALVSQCVLASKPDDQPKLLELFDSYLNNSGFLGSKKKKMSQQIERILGRKVTDQFVRDNIEAVRRGVDFWGVFQRLLVAFDLKKQNRMLSMTADTQSLAQYLMEMLNYLKEENMVWFGRQNLDSFTQRQLKEWLEETTTLAPQCVLASKPDDQSKLLGLFDSYLNNSGFLGSKKKKLSQQIEEILGRKVTDQFVRDNIEAVRRGVDFWGVFQRLLEIFDLEKREELVAMTRDVELFAAHLDEMRGTLGEFESTWHGIKKHDITSEEKKSLQGWLEETTVLVSQCVLTSKPDDQPKLLELFESYLNEFQLLKNEDAKLSQQIEEILGRKVTDQFVRDNIEAMKRGTDFWQIFPDLLAVFGSEQKNRLLSMTENVKSLTVRLDEMRQTLGEFDQMQEFDKNKNDYDSTIIQILKQAKAHAGVNANLAEMIKQEIYAYWLAKIEQENPVLKGEPISNYEKNKKSLTGLLEDKREIVRRSIQREIEGTIHPKEIYGKSRYSKVRHEGSWSEFAAELKRKRRVKPVRKLFESYGSNMLKIAPCWLASPESVSKVFPLKRNLFDLVIVDEASQLAVERAIPLLYRTKRVVIAGDEKQLPPFDLFDIREEELTEDEEEEITEEKSLLDLATRRYKTNNLSWHYRSKYQDLINFSNHAFYEGLLNVAPNVSIDPSQPPIRWIRCNGQWDNNANHVEAKRVVDEIASIWGRYEQHDNMPSIGVITFNERQQEVIHDIIDKRRDSDPTFESLHNLAHSTGKREDSLFVKNIENVQGDERDIIIFSIGYAKNAEGKFINHFGTLNRKGGENRLNVAITRAREEMVVVCSIESSIIRPTSKHEGPRRLKQFLEYAKATDSLDQNGQKAVIDELNPSMKITTDKKHNEFDSVLEIQVYTWLLERGHIVKTQVGESKYKIDLAVVHPGDKNEYVLGIECDGAMFHSARSVRERDVMRQKFLEENGWTIERIWSRHWWKDPGGEIDRIDAKIRELLRNKSSRG